MANGKVVMTGPGSKVFGQAGIQHKARFGQGEGREATQELNQENDRKNNKES